MTATKSNQSPVLKSHEIAMIEERKLVSESIIYVQEILSSYNINIYNMTIKEDQYTCIFTINHIRFPAITDIIKVLSINESYMIHFNSDNNSPSHFNLVLDFYTLPF